jgi:hypothetical protein
MLLRRESIFAESLIYTSANCLNDAVGFPDKCQDVLRQLRIRFVATLDEVIMRFSFESRRLFLVIFVRRTRLERFRVGFTSAGFERDNNPVVVVPELHRAASPTHAAGSRPLARSVTLTGSSS